jgi:hypothetical protein
MNSITQAIENENNLTKRISVFFKKYSIGDILRASNAYKEKGISVVRIFQYLFMLVFRNCTMYISMRSGRDNADFLKDTVYRFKNSININWLHFLTQLSAKIIKETIEKLTDENRANVLIIDDSVYHRDRSKKVELLAKVHDHTQNKYRRGFRMLTLGWSDGNTFLPVNGCLLSSEDNKNRYNEANDIDKRSNGYKRREMAKSKAPQVMLKLLEAAKTALIPAKYVLFDTWFCFPSTVSAVKKVGYDVIAMTKKSSKIRYEYKGDKLPVTEIYKLNKKRRGLSRYLLSVEVNIKNDEDGIPAKLVYVRNRNKRSDYLVLLSTDTSLSEEEIIRIYGKRWDIEVFFKVCKSMLRLTEECRSISYDAMTAQMAIVFARYMMLAVEARIQEDDRSLGDLCFLFSEELKDISLVRAMQIIMNIFRNLIGEYLLLSEGEIDALMVVFLDKLPSELSKLLQKAA